MSAPPFASQHPDPILPWYRHFWPWFIVGLLATSVAAGLGTVAIAFTHQDSLVRDDWYAEGTAINRRFERDALARQLGLTATLAVEGSAVALSLGGEGQGDLRALRLVLSHPTHASRDREVTLVRDPDRGVFRGVFEGPLEGRWYATLRPMDAVGSEADWQLSDTLHLPSARPIPLVPRGPGAGP